MTLLQKSVIQSAALVGYFGRALILACPHWLAATDQPSAGARTVKGNRFTRKTVREMVTNAAYAGFVTAMRSKNFTIRGSHPGRVRCAGNDHG